MNRYIVKKEHFRLHFEKKKNLNLKGRSILVTGAGRGIGREIAVSLNKQGCKVYALSRSKEPLDSLVEEYPDVPIVVDISDLESVKRKLKDMEVLDGLLNNALAYSDQPVPAMDCTQDMISHAIDIQVYGTINIIQIVARKMIDAGRPGSIVNISSILGLQAFPGNMPYCVSKAALDMITKQFALELGPNNIRVNSVNPTFVNTERTTALLQSGIVDNLMRQLEEQTPCQRIPDVSDVAGPVLYLLSDLSKMVTGNTNIIDGGAYNSFIAKPLR